MLMEVETVTEIFSPLLKECKEVVSGHGPLTGIFKMSINFGYVTMESS